MILLASLGSLQPVLAAVTLTISSVSVLTNTLPFHRCTPDEDSGLFDR